LWVPISFVLVLLAEQELWPSPLFGVVPVLEGPPLASALAEPLVLPKNGKIRKKVRDFKI